MKRKRYSKEFKAKVALEAIKGQKTANEIASEYEVHVSQITTWMKWIPRPNLPVRPNRYRRSFCPQPVGNGTVAPTIHT